MTADRKVHNWLECLETIEVVVKLQKVVKQMG
jgi:hypothetical protein